MGDLSDSVVGLIDSLRKLLATLPANPVSEFLSGALYLGRRILKPVGSGVGLFGTVACVATTDCSGQDLTNADLSARILTALDFSGAVLNGVDFSGADLSGADLSMTQLRAANLTDANLLEANLVGADLIGADLDGVTNFGTALLTGADLSGQILIRLDLSGKDLTGTDFVGAILTGTDLSYTQLARANFQGAGLAGVNLSGADLSTAIFDSADLSEVIWGGAAMGAVSTASFDQGLVGSDPSIATNPNFSYADAILAARFSELVYKWREPDFSARVDATGWRGITPSISSFSPGGFTTAAGGYGVGSVAYGFQDGMPVQSFAFAGRRTAGDGTEQFVFAVEGSNSCSLSCLLDRRWIPEQGQDRADWNANLQSYGWSRYYASLQPLMAEVLRQMIAVQKSGRKAQLIITGHSLGGATAMIAWADLLAPQGDLYPADSYTLTSVQVTSGGSGYDSNNPPWVRLEGGGGTGATAVAVVPDREDPDGYYVDYVTEVRITNPGSGYTSAPTVIIAAPPRTDCLNGPCSQAAAVATLTASGGTDVLGKGKRIWDAIGDWTPATLKAVQDATTVYTFGAPSPLIDPVKDPAGLNGVLDKVGASLFDYKKLFEVITAFFVTDKKLPQPFRDGAVNRIFQFEHKGATVQGWQDYADDVVANIGSRDPGTLIPIRLRQDVQEDYVECVRVCASLYGLSAATHGIDLYNESLIRLVTWNALLDGSAPVEGVVGWRTSGGNGSDGRNDVFRDMVSGSSLTVASVQVTSGGSGYDPQNPPWVRLEGGGGTGATAFAEVISPRGTGYVSEVKIINSGTGYSSAPNVILAPPRGAAGDQAVAVATLSGNPANSGKGGNDWYAPASGSSYLADGGPGSDLYALDKSGVRLTVDGRSQSGTDGAIFYGALNGSDLKVATERVGLNVNVTYTSQAGKQQTVLQIKNWDRWATSDVFYVKDVGGRLTLARLPNVKVGPSS